MRILSLGIPHLQLLYEFYRDLPCSVSEMYEPFRPITREVIQSHLDKAQNREAISLALCDQKKIFGHSFVMNLHDDHPVFGIGLTESVQGKGEGRRLMGKMLSLVETEGVIRLSLTVLKKNVRAISLYESFGFCTLCDHTFRETNDSYFMERNIKL